MSKTTVKFSGELIDRIVHFGAKNECALVRAVWIDKTDSPAALLERCDSFGREKGGSMLVASVGELYFL